MQNSQNISYWSYTSIAKVLSRKLKKKKSFSKVIREVGTKSRDFFLEQKEYNL